MSVEVDVYLRDPKRVGGEEWLARIVLKELPSVRESFDGSLLGHASPKFSLEVGARSIGTPRPKIFLIPA